MFYIQFGVDRRPLQSHEFRVLNNKMGVIQFPETRDYEVKVEDGYDIEKTYWVIHDKPYPLRITSITANIDVSD